MKCVKGFAGIVCAALLLTACGCMKSVPKANSNGGLVSYKTVNEIPTSGYYILDQTGIHPLYRDGRNFSDEPSKDTILANRYLTIIGEESLIPTIADDNTYLIYINDTAPLNQDIVLEKMADTGYTFGITFSEIENSEYIGLHESKIVNGSDAETAFKGLSNTGAYTLTEINEYPFTSSYIGQNGFITGLEKNAYYKMVGYKGTEYVEFVVKADTHIYTSTSVLNLTASSAYGLTKSGYAVVQLPGNMESGLYCINGSGVFFYDKNGTAQPAEATTGTPTEGASNESKNIEDIAPTYSVDKVDTDT